MKVNRKVVLMIAFLVLLVSAACLGSCGGNSDRPENADLTIAVGPNTAIFLEENGGLLAEYAKNNDAKIYVKVLYGLDMWSAVSSDSFDVFIADDHIIVDGLESAAYIASYKAGLWVRVDKAKEIGLVGNTISITDYMRLLKSGSINSVAGNATASADTAEFFYSLVAWCAGVDSYTLTMEMVNNSQVMDCGKDAFDYIKTVTNTSDAVNTVFVSSMDNTSNAFMSVIAGDYAFLGSGGYNDQLINAGKPHFVFFYFRESTPNITVAMAHKKGLSDEKLQLVSNLQDYLLSDDVQKRINLAGFGNGSSAMVESDQSAFVSDWGVYMHPKGVRLVNPPFRNVGESALFSYVSFYKRPKEIGFCIDTSGSMRNSESTTEIVDGKEVRVSRPRLQLASRAILTVTGDGWLRDNSILTSPGDRVSFRLYSDWTTPVVVDVNVSSLARAGREIDDLIGPAWDTDDNSFVFQSSASKVNKRYDGYKFNMTATFECAEAVRSEFESRYDPNVDYYIVILTDGKKSKGLDGIVFNYDGTPNLDKPSFYKNWYQSGRDNISLIGIQFGNEGQDVSPDVTKYFNGKSYDGTNDLELIQAFKDIFGN
jgi:hypothetical protein